MKKFLFLSLICLIAFAAQAQDNTLIKKIRQANATVKSFETDLNNTLVKRNKKNEQDGKLYFVCPDKFAALFNNGKHMIVNVNHLKMNIGLFHGTFKLRDDGMMRSLSNIFLYGFQGRCEDLAKDNNYTINVLEKGPYQQVCCNNKKRSLLGIGYKTVIFNYDKDSLMLRQIVLIDNSDNVDTYTISNVQYNVNVDDSVFSF
jgi:outer membrane lipoprotein-sorting protein